MALCPGVVRSLGHYCGELRLWSLDLLHRQVCVSSLAPCCDAVRAERHSGADRCSAELSVLRAYFHDRQISFTARECMPACMSCISLVFEPCLDFGHRLLFHPSCCPCGADRGRSFGLGIHNVLRLPDIDCHQVAGHELLEQYKFHVPCLNGLVNTEDMI